MTLTIRTICGSFFARNNLSELLPLPIHDTAVAPDVLYSVSLNYEWRKIIVSIVEEIYDYNRSRIDDAELTAFDSEFTDLLWDFYD